MPRILIAECKQEVSSFNPVASHYDDFRIVVGDALLPYHRRMGNEIAGALSVFDATPDVDIVPTYSAQAITSGGTLAAADWQRLAGEFLGAIRAAPPVDGVYFCLHGAMAADGEDDPEGYLLAETRKILGESIPIVVSLDLHGILTDQMLRHSDAIVVYHTYPHVDFFTTGQRSARLLLDILAGRARPVTATVAIPALVRGDELITETGLFGRSIRDAQALETGPGGLSAGMFIGNPFTDVTNLRSNSLVVLNGDADRAAREAVRLAEDFWAVRERLQAHLTPLAEAVRQAKAHQGGTTVLVDAADATSSGASGDSNAILCALAAVGYQGRSLMPMVDPQAVEAAMAAGIGATVHTTLGGRLDPRFSPMPVEARVKLLSDGRYRSERAREPWFAGDTAVLEVGSATVIATSRAVSLYDRSLFWAHGAEPRDFDLVVVKSPHCEPQMFKDWASLYINVDAPGSTSANLPSLGHRVCQRPIFPLDDGVTFTPQPRLYQRG